MTIAYETLLSQLAEEIKQSSPAFTPENFWSDEAHVYDGEIEAALKQLKLERLTAIFVQAPAIPVDNDLWAPTGRGIMENVVFWLVADELKRTIPLPV